MKIQANTTAEYLDQLTEDRKLVLSKLIQVLNENLPKGFMETMSYGMIGFVVPHSIYPDGYHCDPKLPLPFINIASQKNFVALYHMGIYANPNLLEWFTNQFPNHSKSKLDMGKSCVRFKKMADIPYQLIAELAQKITVEDWIKMYENQYKPKK